MKGSKYQDVKEFLNKFNFKVKIDPKRNHEDNFCKKSI